MNETQLKFPPPKDLVEPRGQIMYSLKKPQRNRMRHTRLTCLPVFSLLLLTTLPPARAELPPAAELRLFAGGVPQVTVVTSATAVAETALAARDLAALLSAICGTNVEMTCGDGTTGLAVGAASDFPALEAAGHLNTNDLLHCDDYLIRTHAKGAALIGVSPDAARHAVWDLLYRLGYRRFFAPKKWEIIPALKDAALTADVLESPSYLGRRIWYGYGAWPENKGAYTEWCARNRGLSAFELNTGHSYDNVLHRNKAAFDAHPEYKGLVGGVRKSSKFCVSNPGLRELVADQAVAAFRANPSLQSVSCDPSDGGGWCECEACAALGTVTDRALTLANAVAEAVQREIGQGYVGMYAYNMHSPPPEKVRVHPRVIISVATSFIKGGLTLDGLITGWNKMGSSLFGIREYYSVNTWDRDVPGAARGGNLTYLANTITNFHAKGARFISAESSDNWGPNGLGYYLASRMLWNTNEASNLEALKEDFFEKAFGPARDPMRAFYKLIDGANRPLLSPDLIGRMYRGVGEARQLAGERADVLARVNDLLLYTRYAELYMRYTETRGPEHQQAFENLIRHAYRMRLTDMVHSYALYRDLAGRDKGVKIPEGAQWQKPEPGNPWKSSAPFTTEELDAFLRNGLEANKPVDFTPVTFDAPLVRPDALRLPAAANSNWTETAWQSRHKQRLYVWVDRAPTTLVFTVTGGLITNYRDRGNARLALTPEGEAEGKPVAEGDVPPDGNPREVKLATTYAGLHYLDVNDGGDSTRIDWPAGLPVTFKTSLGSRFDYNDGPRFFYVPKGTPLIAGFAAGFSGELAAPDGKKMLEWKGEHRYFSVPVPAGLDGAVWSFKGNLGKKQFHLMTVPPYFARTPAELLLPEDVVKKDAP